MHRITVSAPPPAEKTPLLISRSYALLWDGQAISSLGDTVFMIAAILWIATRLAPGLSWAPLAVGGVYLASELPEIVVGPIAGGLYARATMGTLPVRAAEPAAEG